jgi:O-antigen biosynthesis protein WbqP
MPKIRTMKRGTPQLASHLIDNADSFYTPLGKFLRQYSIDEIPQLFSVIQGNMSFVGPRPALFNQTDLIELRNKFDICTLDPGITGWAQVNGRDELSIESKVNFDAEYLKRKSFCFDLYIIWLTLLKVIKRDGVTH